MAQINDTANIGQVSGVSWVDSAVSYFFSLPSLVMQGDYFAIMLSLILVYFILIILNKISGLILVVIKKIMSLAITVLALLFVYTKFMASLSAEGITAKVLIIGVIGILITVLGSIISFYSLFKSTKKAISTLPIKIKDEKSLNDSKPEIDLNQLKEFKKFFSLDSLKNEKSLLSVLTFLLVAEFGVFSSVTITAPDIKAGIIIFSIFIILSFVFIKQSYKNYKKGVAHIVITFIFGFALAIVLGHYWANIPFSTLFSFSIFKTSCLVALMSGMALSLFAGSRN